MLKICFQMYPPTPDDINHVSPIPANQDLLFNGIFLGALSVQNTCLFCTILKGQDRLESWVAFHDSQVPSSTCNETSESAQDQPGGHSPTHHHCQPRQSRQRRRTAPRIPGGEGRLPLCALWSHHSTSEGHPWRNRFSGLKARRKHHWCPLGANQSPWLGEDNPPPHHCPWTPSREVLE